jgi:tetratricopeptide (TPR) repeat protein
LKFPSWKKEKPSASKGEENMLNEEPAAHAKTESSHMYTDTKETTTDQSPQINIEINEEKQEASKLEDTRDYIVKVITKAGFPLVIRSEQNITIQEEIRSEIALLLEDNKKLTEEVLKSNRQVADDDEYLLRTANFYYLQDNTEKSIELYDRVLKRNPSKMTALNNKGVMLDSTGKHDEAVEYFNKALSSVPENVHVLCNKGIALYKNQKYEEALGCFDSALKLESNYLNALIFKGHTFYRLGKNNDALASYSKVIRLEQNNAEALYNKACLCSLKGDEYGALTSLERAIRLDPSWKSAAMGDKDLEHIKNNPRFSELVQSSN